MRTPIAIDTETCATIGYKGIAAPPLVCLTYCAGEESGIVHVNGRTDDARNETLHSFLKIGLPEILKSRSGVLVGANIAFDVGVLCNTYPDLLPLFFDLYEQGKIEDVQLNQRLIDIATGHFPHLRGYSLARCAKRRLDLEMDKDTWRLKYHELLDVPCDQWPAGARDYAIGDAVTTRDVWLAQYATAEERGVLETLKDGRVQAGPAFALWLTSARGIRTDAVAVEAYKQILLKEQGELRAQLIEYELLRKDNTRNTKNAQARMQAINPDCEMTPTGKPSMSAEACKSSGDAVLIAYSRYTSLGHTLANYITALEKGVTWPIQTYFTPLLATGRTSSSRPNIQNQKREAGVRECFIPRDGFVFLACDFSNAEMHTFAQVLLGLFGESKLADALNAGKDAHLVFAAVLMGIGYDEALSRYKAGDTEVKKYRQRAKAANFGYPGGLGAETFLAYARGYGAMMTLNESQALKDAWLHTYPEVQQYFKWINAQQSDVDGKFYITQPVSGRLRGGMTYCQACNTTFQGLASDGAKAALFAVVRECYIGSLRGSYVVNFVHDELILEVPDDANEMDRVANSVSAIMAREFNKFVPDCPTEAEPALARRWSKSMELVRDAQGRITVWEPEEVTP